MLLFSEEKLHFQTKSGAGDADALKMENLNGVFYVLLVGSAFASLYGIVEWMIIIFLRAKRQNVRNFSIRFFFVLHDIILDCLIV